MRTNAEVNGVSSDSVPANSFNWPRSSFGAGSNTMVPSPSSTIAVTPSGVSATNDIASRQAQLEIHRLQHEVARRELFLRVQRQAMQAFDRREAILRR